MRGKRIPSAILATAVLVFLLAGIALAQAPASSPVGTGFTYQGQLKSSGTPYTGVCDLTFGLWDALSGGSQIGTTQTKTNVDLAEGYFTVQLDFGSTAFRGAARWLEIAVRCPAGSGGYTTLDPRQALTPAPYSLYSQAAPWSGLTGVPAGFADGLDNDTTYSAGTGLTLASGEFAVGAAYRLPQACANGQIAEWNGSLWACGNDDVGTGGGAGDITAVKAGTGLTGGGESGDVELSLDTTYADAQYVNEAQEDSVISHMIVDGQVTKDDLEDGAALAEIQDDDGTGSGLDADLLDGQHGSYYAPANRVPHSCSANGSGFTSAGTGVWEVVTSCYITLAADGWVFVEASAGSAYYTGAVHGIIGLGVDSTDPDSNSERVYTIQDLYERVPLSAAKTFSLSAGTHTITFLAMTHPDSTGLVYLSPYSLSVIYAPN